MAERILADLNATNGVPGGAGTRQLGAKAVTSISSAARRVIQPAGDITDDFRLNAIGYLRVSTDEQGESGLGLDAQRASITAAAGRLGRDLWNTFVDAGVSGSLAITARPVLMQAVLTLQAGDVLLVAKRDRLGRDPIAVAMIERLVTKRGARVVSAAGEGTDGEEPSNLLMRRMIDAFAEYERLLIAARTKAGLAAKRARGERAGTLPFGYQLAPDDPDAQRIEPAPVEQRLIARIRDRQAEGWSTRQIAEDLNAQGWTTRRGTPWRFEYVARMARGARR